MPNPNYTSDICHCGHELYKHTNHAGRCNHASCGCISFDSRKHVKVTSKRLLPLGTMDLSTGKAELFL